MLLGIRPAICIFTNVASVIKLKINVNLVYNGTPMLPSLKWTLVQNIRFLSALSGDYKKSKLYHQYFIRHVLSAIILQLLAWLIIVPHYIEHISTTHNSTTHSSIIIPHLHDIEAFRCRENGDIIIHNFISIIKSVDILGEWIWFDSI